MIPKNSAIQSKRNVRDTRLQIKWLLQNEEDILCEQFNKFVNMLKNKKEEAKYNNG